MYAPASDPGLRLSTSFLANPMLLLLRAVDSRRQGVILAVTLRFQELLWRPKIRSWAHQDSDR